MKCAIEEELRARYQPADQLSPELRRLLRQIPCSDIRDAASETTRFVAPPPDSKAWEGKPDKLQYFSPNPGEGD